MEEKYWKREPTNAFEFAGLHIVRTFQNMSLGSHTDVEFAFYRGNPEKIDELNETIPEGISPIEFMEANTPDAAFGVITFKTYDEENLEPVVLVKVFNYLDKHVATFVIPYKYDPTSRKRLFIGELRLTGIEGTPITRTNDFIRVALFSLLLGLKSHKDYRSVWKKHYTGKLMK
jgi:hypothetical protein